MRAPKVLLHDHLDGGLRPQPVLDANAQRAGVTRAEYLRRVLAEQRGRALTREQLDRFAERTADLGNPEVMTAAWR